MHSTVAQQSIDPEAIAALLPARQRLRRGFQQIERARQGIRMLLVVDDEAGVLGSADVRRLFGELLEHTYQLQLLICSRQPVYQSLGTTKVVNILLKGLSETEAARLFLQRIHRPLGPQDFPDAVSEESSPPSARTTIESAVRRLSGHPLLQRLAGHPGRIRAASSRVTPGGPSLMALAAGDDLVFGPKVSEGGDASPLSPWARTSSSTASSSASIVASMSLLTRTIALPPNVQTPSFGCPVDRSGDRTENHADPT